MISPRHVAARMAAVVLVAVGIVMIPPMTSRAGAEPNAAAAYAATNAIWLDYVREHSDVRDLSDPIVINPNAPKSSAALTQALMKGRRPSKRLHLLGDDHFNIEPRRIGPLGFGLSAGGEF